jgi:1-phosphatidylinositol-3-phosphate 5-kinase
LEATPLFIREHSKKYLVEALCNDTLFLYKQNVMDYSLLVGLDEKNQELVVGIVGKLCAV